MARLISTNFTLRLAEKTKPIIIGDERISSKLQGENFYSTTYIVDRVGTFLGEINDFIAISCKEPILIEFQRVEMKESVQIYCDSLFIHHGNLGKVWLRVPQQIDPVITTVWYSTDNKIIDSTLYINVKPLDNSPMKKLRLKNLNGKALALPIEKHTTFVGIDNTNKAIPIITHKGERKLLPAHNL